MKQILSGEQLKPFALRVLAALACLATAILMGGCSSYPSVDEARAAQSISPVVSSPAVMTDGVLTVGVNTDNAPYCWVADSTTGELAGLDVEIAVKIAEELGLTVRFVNVGGNALAAGQGLCDIVMGVNAGQLTSGIDSFVAAYAESATAVFAKNYSGSLTFDQLLQGSIGVQASSTSALVLAGISTSIPTTSFTSLNDLFTALESGQITYAVCDSFLGAYLALGYDDISFAGALEMPTSRGIAIATSNTVLISAVQQAMDTLASNGLETSILNSYVGDLPSISLSNVLVSVPVSAEAVAEAVATGEEHTEEAAA